MKHLTFDEAIHMLQAAEVIFYLDPENRNRIHAVLQQNGTGQYSIARHTRDGSGGGYFFDARNNEYVLLIEHEMRIKIAEDLTLSVYLYQPFEA